jgi:arsenate reductase (thioredoxin)
MSHGPQIDAQLRSVVDGLVNHTQGAIPRDRLSALVDNLYDEMSASARVKTFIPILVERAAFAQVEAGLPEAEAALHDKPEVLIVCQENAGRSQAAAALFRHYAPGLLFVESAGLTPADRVQQSVLDLLAERGVQLTDAASALQQDMLARAKHLILIGDVDLSGPDLHVWDDIPSLDGLKMDEVEEVLTDLDQRVRDLLSHWLPELELAPAVMQHSVHPI